MADETIWDAAAADPLADTDRLPTQQSGAPGTRWKRFTLAQLKTFLAGVLAPAAHKTTHENGGADEISVAGLSGALADPQTPAAHASTHYSGGSDPLAGALSATTLTATSLVTMEAGFRSTVAGDERLRATGGEVRLPSDGHVKFYSDPDIASGAADVGLNRAAAGRLNVTNGGAGAGALDVGNLRLGTSTLSSTDTNGPILLDPDGTGNVQIVSGLLQFLGSTSSFPALKRNGVGVEIRLADDSSYGTLTIRTGPPGLFFGGTGATNAAVRTTAAAVPLLEFVTATESAYANIAAARLTLNGTTVGLFTGAGTPEGAVTAGIGSIFLRTDGGAATSIYVKESGAGNTGWVAK